MPGRAGLVACALGLAAVAGCGGQGQDAGIPIARPVVAPSPTTGVGRAHAVEPVAGGHAPRPAATRQPARRRRARPPRPPIIARPIPFGARRKAEMVRYAERHYGLDTYRLVHPRVIVEHYTETATATSAYATFAADVADAELHELPGTCAHFIVEPDGSILQLVPTNIMCRHTVGLNWTAIGIENVGMSDADVMGRPAERRASLALTRWLRCTYGVSVGNVIGHHESLASPYHHEGVPALRTQTHDDMRTPTMDRYRGLLADEGC